MLKEIKIAVAYIIQGKRYTSIPSNPQLLEDPDLEVEYIIAPTWDEDISEVRDFKELPKAAKQFVELYEKLINEVVPHYVQIKRLGVGPGINDEIIC